MYDRSRNYCKCMCDCGRGPAGVRRRQIFFGPDAEDAPVEEQYAICVTKGNTELLTAINEVLDTLLKKDENGVTEIEKLVMKHMGLE